MARGNRDEYKHLTKEEKDEIFKLVYKYYIEERLSVRQLFPLIDCTHNTIESIIRDYGIEKTKEQVDADRQYKFEKTCMEKYGQTTPLFCEEFQKQIKETMTERYGVEYPSRSKEIRKKMEATCIERFGVRNSMMCEEVKEKSKATCREHYGCDYYVQTDESKQKIEASLQKRFEETGAVSIAQLDKNLNKSYEHLQILNSKEKFTEFLNSIPKKDLRKQDICEMLDIGIAQFNWRLRKWDLKNYVFHRNGSHYEVELCDLMKEWGIKYLRDYRKLIRNPDTNVPLEIDIYLPEEHIGIEFNGIAWHDKENPIRENKKTMLCQEKGVKLIHIWEDDWLANKQKIIDNLHDEIFDYCAVCSVEAIDIEPTVVYDISVPQNNNFVLDNGCVVHNSYDTRQQLTTMGFSDVKLVSLDRKPDGYLCLRSALNERRLMLPPDMPTIEKELINLERDNQTGKIDHNVENSKDLSDSLAGAIFNASEHNSEFTFAMSEMFGDALEENTEGLAQDQDRELFLQSLVTPLSNVQPRPDDNPQSQKKSRDAYNDYSDFMDSMLIF